MRIFVSALFVASSIAVGIAQGEPGAPPAPRPGTQAPAPGGQQPATQPPAPREQPAPKPQTSQTNTMTIAGCIQSAPAAAAGGGAAGAAGGAAAAGASAQGRFVLANAKPAGGAAGAAVGTAGTAATRYQLEGEEKTISPHLNHQVEITGTVQPAAGGAAAGGAAAAPMLKVESVKMVAAKCS
jgi:hypothetical protein